MNSGFGLFKVTNYGPQYMEDYQSPFLNSSQILCLSDKKG